MRYLYDKKYPHYIIPPRYGNLNKNGYGTSMTVVLGPGAGIFYAGSKTTAKSLSSIMRKLAQRDGQKKWVAGHLLNGELGGSGIDSQNLAALTQTANKQHSGYELKVKRLCIKMRQWHEMPGRSKLNYFLGVQYTVAVKGTFGDFPPYKYVPSHFKISAIVYRYDKITRKRSNCSQAEFNHFLKDMFVKVEIHNRDDHVL